MIAPVRVAVLATIALTAPALLAVVGGLGPTAVTTLAGGAIGVAMREEWATGWPPR